MFHIYILKHRELELAFDKQRQSVSNMLADIYSKKAVSLLNAAASHPLPLELKPWLSLSKQDQQSVVLFSGAVIQAEQLTVKIKP